MNKFLYKIGLSVCVLILFFSYLTPIAFAQQNLFDSLDDIKNKVETPQTRPGETPVTVKVVDFSNSTDNPWGGLPQNVIDILIGEGYKSLDDIVKETGYSQSKGNVDVLTKRLSGIKGLVLLNSDGSIVPDKDGKPSLNDSGNLVISAIRFKGESQLYAIILTVTRTVRNLMGGLAVLWIILSGIRMIFAQGEENVYTEQKQSITYALIGLAVILLIERGVTIVYGTPGALRGLATTGAGITPEVLGVIAFIKALMGALAILMIMVSGYKIIASVGEEEKLTNQKKAIMWVIIGIVLILINQFIVENLYIKPAMSQIGGGAGITQTNVTNIINLFGTVTQYLLGFVGLVAFAALIYGAASLIANFGNDEMAGKAKKIITNAIIGIIVILSAFAIVSTLIKFG